MTERDEKPIRVMLLGLRGFPGVQGGVEKHVEELSPRLARFGCQVGVVVRSPYVDNEGTQQSVDGLRFIRLWSPRRSGVEALVHSVIGILYAGFTRPDLVHIHAIGPAITAPLARLLGLRVVMTHHGFDYDRTKWGAVARAVLRTGERLGVRYSNACIAVSMTIGESVRRRLGTASVVIPNGVPIPEIPDSTEALRRFNLAPQRYILQVSRFVPEKNQCDLIRAFARSGLSGWQLVLVGQLDLNDPYSREVVRLAESTPGIILTGFQAGTALSELYAHAGGFVLPSSHEGLPIALLEAMSYGLRVAASAIAANLEVGLPKEHYFTVGDVDALSQKLRWLTERHASDAEREALRRTLQQRYDWDRIARQTLRVYRAALSRCDRA